METTTQTSVLPDLLMFIRMYRQMEQASLEVGFQRIRAFAKHHADHLMGHWKGKKKEFGRFFLNLDYKHQHSLVKAFGIDDKNDELFIEKAKADPIVMLFERPTGFLRAANNLLVFFENHGIDPDPIGNGSLMLNHLPGAKKRYGNSANWGDYILSLTMVDQVRVINTIINLQAN